MKYGEVMLDPADQETVMVICEESDGFTWWVLILAYPGGSIEPFNTTTRDVSTWEKVD